MNDKKIKIEISNLNWLVKFSHVIINKLCTQYYDGWMSPKKSGHHDNSNHI